MIVFINKIVIEIHKMEITKISVGELKTELSNVDGIDKCTLRPHIKSCYIGNLDDNKDIQELLKYNRFSIPFLVVK